MVLEPTKSALLSGGKPGPHKIQGIGVEFILGNADTCLFDKVSQITGENAMAMAQQLATKDGIFCRISSRAAVATTIEVGM